MLRERFSATVSIPYFKQIIILIRHSERSPENLAKRKNFSRKKIKKIFEKP